jgi:steroid delta-isomerase-like uncharacterized protein
MRATRFLPGVLAALVAAGCVDDKSKGAPTAASAAPSTSAAAIAPTAAPAPHGLQTPTEMATGFAKKLAPAFAAHDAHAAAALFAKDAVVSLAGDPDADRGSAAIEKDFADTLGRYKDAKLAIGRVWVSKPASVIEIVFSGTRSAGEMMGRKVAERPVGFVGALVVVFDGDGLVKTERRYLDLATNIGQVEPTLLPAGMKVRPVTTAVPAGTDVFESKATDQEASNLAVDRKLHAANDAHDADAFAALLADDATSDDFTSPGTATKKQVRTALQTTFAAFPDFKVVSKPLELAAGDYVVTEVVSTGTQKGSTAGVGPTNKTVTIHQLNVEQYRVGKAVRSWTYGNGLEFLTQLGLMKAPGAAQAPPAPAVSATGP